MSSGMRLVGLVLLLALGSGAAFGQTYVRPSKGTAFNPFPGQRLDSNTSRVSGVYDWTAFSSARVQVFGIGTGQNGTGVACTSVTPIDHNFNNTNNYIKFVIQRVGTQSEIYLTGSGTKDGTFGLEYQNGYYAVTRYEVGTNFNNYQKFGSCDVSVLVTPLPFEQGNSSSTEITDELIRASGSYCYPGSETLASVALNSTSWTAITPSTLFDTGAITVCNSVLNAFAPVYCVLHDASVQAALSTPPHTLISSAYVIQPGECHDFGPSSQLTSTGFFVPIRTPSCASADSVSVGVRKCDQARRYY